MALTSFNDKQVAPLRAMTILVALWIGFVCAISFMEAWLKFTASGITLPLGLGIGRVVFAALNRVEWTIALLIGISLWRIRWRFNPRILFFIVIPLFILLLQTVWLLPALDSRASIWIAGGTPPPSPIHWIYISLEVVKVLALISLLVLWIVKPDSFIAGYKKPTQTSHVPHHRTKAGMN